MPRPSEIQAEENATPRSPLRRSCRIVAVSSPAPSEVKPVKGRRLSAVSNDGRDEEEIVEVKPASRATRASSVTKENGPAPEPAKTRARRNSATTESSTAVITEEKKPAARGRRSSVTTEETEIETAKPTRGRRPSVTKEETEIETTKPVRGRRPSITKETEDKKPVKGRRSSIQEDKEEESTKKPVKGRRSSIQEDKEEESAKKPEEPPLRSTRSRRASKDLSDDIEETKQNKDVETADKRNTRSRRASVEAAEEKEDKKPAPRTPSKLKRRLSVTENAVVLDPIDEKEQEHESPTKPELLVVVTKRKPEQVQVKVNLDLSVISESEEAEATRAKSRLSNERESINMNDEKVNENVEDNDKSKEAPEKISGLSNPGLSVVLNKSLEGGRKTPDIIKSEMSVLLNKPLEGGRKTPELSVLLNKSLEDGRRTPDSPARRSPRLIEKCKSGEKHVHMKCNCGEPPTKTKKIDFEENKESSTGVPNKENAETTKKQEPEDSLTVESTKEPETTVDDAVFLPETITENEKTGTKTHISDGSDGSFQLNLSKSKFESTEDEADLNDSKTSESSDKENLAQNIDVNGKEMNTKITQLSDKKVLEDLTDLGNKDMPSQNVTVARVSNVFRPKDIDYSYMEPMDVDMTMDTTKLEKSHLNSTKLQTEGANETVDETFSLSLNVTCVESPTEKDAPVENVKSDECVKKSEDVQPGENEASKINKEKKIDDTVTRIGGLDKAAINEQAEVINTSHEKIFTENQDRLETTVDQENLMDKSPKKETHPTKEDKSPEKLEKSPIKEVTSPAKAEKSATKEDKSHAEVEKSPTKVDTIPTKLENNSTKEDTSPEEVKISPRKEVEKSPTKEDKIPAEVEKILTKEDKSPAKLEKSPIKEDKSPAKLEKSPTKEDKIPAEVGKILTKEDKSPAKEDKIPTEAEKIPTQDESLAKVENGLTEENKSLTEVQKSPTEENISLAEAEKSPAKEESITKDTSHQKNDPKDKKFDAEDVDDEFEDKSMSEDYEFEIPSEEETENVDKSKSKKSTNEENPRTGIQKENEHEKPVDIVAEEEKQKEDITVEEMSKSTEEKLLLSPIDKQTEEIDNEVCKEASKEDRTDAEVEGNQNKLIEDDINEMESTFKDIVNDDEAIADEPLEDGTLKDGQLKENATEAVEDKLEAAKEQDKKIKRLSTVMISEEVSSFSMNKKSKRKSKDSFVASTDQEVISPKMAAKEWPETKETKRDSIKSRLSNDKSKTEKRFSLTEWFEENIVKETDKTETTQKSKKKKRKTIELNESQFASDDAEEKRKSNISVEIIEDSADLNVPLIQNIEENNDLNKSRKRMKKNQDISVEIIENEADLTVSSQNKKEKSKHNASVEIINEDKIKRLSLEEFANAKLDEYIARKMDDLDAEEENSCSYEDSESGNSYIDDMAEEGEEDTPSEDSNAIIEEGEAINSDSERSEDHDDDDDDSSFICDEENIELLSGEEYDLGERKEKKRKSRIINVENRNEDIIKFEKKPTPKPKKSRIIKIDDSSSDEDLIVDAGLNEDNIVDSSKKGGERSRHSSINIIENIDVKEIRDAALSSRINQLVDSFCTTIPDKGGVSMNLSLDFTAKPSSEEETATTTTKRRSKGNRKSLPSTEPSTSKRMSTESLNRNSTSNEVVPPKQPRLSASLIEDSNTRKNKQKRRLSKSMDGSESESKKHKKRKTNKSKKTNQEDNLQLNTSISSEDLRKHTFGLMSQLLNDVKNRPRRVIKPSTTKLEDLNSTWLVESDVQIKPSTTIVSEKEMEAFKNKKCHPKDFRQQMLHDSSRVKRIETKQLLRKKGAYY